MQPSVAIPSSSEQVWTVLCLINWAADHLVTHGFDEARLHVELLLAHVLRCSRLELYTNFDRPLTAEELSSFKILFKRRLTHEPLQYILGETEFMGLLFFVDSNVLIPRPETELLVETVSETVRASGKKELDVLDIGTGSGNIPVSLARFFPSMRITSIDASENALAVARRNAERNNVSGIIFLHADVFSDFLEGKPFDLIVSNPPYISLIEFGLLGPEVRNFEPRIATTDESDGLRFVRRIAEIASQRLTAGGRLFMEIAYDQSANVSAICTAAGLTNVESVIDLSGHPRIISAMK